MEEENEHSDGISDSIVQRSNIDSSSGKLKISDSVLQRAAFAGDEGVAVGNARDVNVEINKIIQYQETIYCPSCGVCVVKTGTFKCTNCERGMCLTHKISEQAICGDCSDLHRQEQDVQIYFTDKRTRRPSFDTSSILDIGRDSFGTARASLAIRDDFGVEKIHSLDESKMRNYYRVGRDLTNDIIIPDQIASRNHAQIVPTREGFYIRDSSSLNGVYINKRKVEEAKLREGDVIFIGDHFLYFSEQYQAIVYLNGPFKGIVGLLGKIKIKKDFQIGRCHTSEIKIDPGDDLASRHHARIIYNNGVYFIEDIGSTNETFVNGEEIEGMVRLKDGDSIGIGGTEMAFRLEGL